MYTLMSYGHGKFHSRVVVDFEDVVKSHDSRMVELLVNVVLTQGVSAMQAQNNSISRTSHYCR